jgi:hypothetical protein
MQIDQLNTEECHKIIKLIGNGARPLRASRLLFPEQKMGAVLATKQVREYCYNKISVLNKELLFGTRYRYNDICSRILRDMPMWARKIPDELLKEE